MIWYTLFSFLLIIQPFLSRASHTTEYNILDFGAVADGKTVNSKAIQKAIDKATQTGGKVIIPKGKFLSGTLFLKSNMVFEVQEGAVVFGSPDIKDYTEMTWGHNPDRQPYHLIVAKGAENLTIQGGGTIDGNWTAFCQPFDSTHFPQWVLAKSLKVSPMIEIQQSKNIHIKDVTLKTGGGWTLHLYDSDLIQVQGIKILNNLYSPNGDGIDISGCMDVTISDCIIKTCDDAICLKTMGDTRECKRVTVDNCIIECSCAALKIGNESFRDISQVTFSNCVIFNSSRAIGIYAESAGKIYDVVISNIVCDTKAPLLYNRPIHICLMNGNSPNMTGDWLFKTEKYFDREGREPALKNVVISNFICRTEGRILIAAQPGMMIENLVMRDIVVTYPYIENPITYVNRIKSSQFSPKNPEARKACAALVVENVKNFVLDGLIINWPDNPIPPKDWQHPVRIANGTLDLFHPDYATSKPVEFSALWGRNLQGGYINAPLATSSDNQLKKWDLENSTITNR